MSQLIATKQNLSSKAPDAEESIALCKALFSVDATRRKLRKVFDKLPDKSRGLVLIAGGLPARDYQRPFESFDDMELQKIRNGMQYLKNLMVSLDNELGDVRRLKYSRFKNSQ